MHDSAELTPFDTADFNGTSIPAWGQGELVEPPRFTRREVFAMVGPGILLAGAAIGGGEWLLGPTVTALYGGAFMWLAAISIIAQVFYNLEVSRYALYTGEPIFTGKFRLRPGPMFWLVVYLILDFGAIFPYVAATAATPAAALWLGQIPDPKTPEHHDLLIELSYAIFVLAFVPLFFGRRIYHTVKCLMTVKVFMILGFLTVLSLLYTDLSTWSEIFAGFIQIGNVPLRDGSVENALLCLATGNDILDIDWSVIPTLAAFAAIAGSGGLTNATISNYTRDQGWGMGHHVGAIPGIAGGKDIQLSHVGVVFRVNEHTLDRWQRWFQVVLRDQLMLWLPACLLGVALPSMLSVGFLERGTIADDWTVAGMTADGVQDHVTAESGATIGRAFWYMTLFCGFLVLAPSMTLQADTLVRRWVDVLWTAVQALRARDVKDIKYLYFGGLCIFFVLGLFLLSIAKPLTLVLIAGNILNFALGFSCWHTVFVNHRLLPRELRPGWLMTTGLIGAGLFFNGLATVALFSWL